MIPFEEKMSRGGGAAIEEASRFFMGEGPVQETLHRLVANVEELNIPYAVAGAMALGAHGYQVSTVDVDVLVTSEGLEVLYAALEGHGYTHVAGKRLRDAETSVRIDFMVAGQFPGDGKAKPIAFPDPSKVAIEIDGVKYVGLVSLMEMKLASGMSNSGRLRDLADVQELIKVLKLPKNFVGKLNVYVRGKFEELFEAVEQDQSGG